MSSDHHARITVLEDGFQRLERGMHEMARDFKSSMQAVSSDIGKLVERQAATPKPTAMRDVLATAAAAVSVIVFLATVIEKQVTQHTNTLEWRVMALEKQLEKHK